MNDSSSSGIDSDSRGDVERDFEAFRSRGDAAALARVFDATAPELLAVARYLVRREGEAEDLVQATFLSAIERSASFTSGRSVLPWLLGILSMHARKWRHRRGIEDLGSVDVATRDAGPADAAHASEFGAAIDRALASLPETYRRVVSLHLRDRLAPREIAATLRLEPGTARVQLHRGLKLLRESIPTGFAGWSVANAPGRGLDAVRVVVVRSASSNVASTTVASGGATAAWFLASVAAVVLAVLALHGSSDPSSNETGAFVSPVEAPTGASTLASSVEHVSLEAADASERVAVDPGSSAEIGSTARSTVRPLTGRLLLPDGRPAVGARLRLVGRPDVSPKGSKVEPPETWKDPPPFVADADGRFRVNVALPRSGGAELRAEAEGCAELEWWLRRELLEPSGYDVGEQAFARACTLVVTILDVTGSRRHGSGYSVVVTPAEVRGTPNLQKVQVECDREDKDLRYVLNRVPEGRVEVRLRTPLESSREPVIALASPASPVTLTIVDTGPEPVEALDRQLIVQTSIRGMSGTTPSLEFVRLRGHGRDDIRPDSAFRSRNSSLRFVGLEPGTYSLTIDDPRYEPLVANDLATGRSTIVRVRGSGRVRCKITAGEPAIPVLDYRLSGELAPEGDHSGCTISMHEPRSELPEGDLYTGLVPGRWTFRIESPTAGSTIVEGVEIRARETSEPTLHLSMRHRVHGVVRRADGAPLPESVAVQITQGAWAGKDGSKNTSMSVGGRTVTDFQEEVRTDAAGRFEFTPVVAGTYTVRAVHGSWLVTDRTIEVKGADEELTIELPSSGAVVGDILFPDAQGRERVAVQIDARGGTPPLPVEMRIGVEGRARPSSGRLPYRIGPVSPGTYQLSLFVVADYDPDIRLGTNWGPPVIVEVVAGKETRHDFDLRETFPGRARVHVTVDGADAMQGRLESIPTTLRKTWGGTDMANIGKDGRALMVMQHPGTYRYLYVSEDSRWAYLRPEPVEISSGAEAVVDVAIVCVERDVRFVDSKGRALANRLVHALPPKIEFRRGGPEITTTRSTVERPPKLIESPVRTSSTTDANGVARMRLPIAPVMFLDDSSGVRREVDWTRDPEGALTVTLAVPE